MHALRLLFWDVFWLTLSAGPAPSPLYYPGGEQNQQGNWHPPLPLGKQPFTGSGHTEPAKREASRCPENSSYPAPDWPAGLSSLACMLAWVLGLRRQSSPRRRQMTPHLCMCFYFQTLKLILVGLQLPDTAKSRGRGYVESLDLHLTSRAGPSKSFQVLQPQPCVVQRNSVCFTALFVGLNE